MMDELFDLMILMLRVSSSSVMAAADHDDVWRRMQRHNNH